MPRRRLVLLGLFALAAVAVLAGWGWLSSPAGARYAAARLRAVAGDGVTLGRVAPGVSTTTLRDVRVGGDDAWLTADAVTANASVAGLALGRTPSEVTANGAKVVLRFAENGDLLTPMPEGAGSDAPPPRVVAEDATLTILQAGHPEFRVGGVDLRAEPEGDKIAFAGTVDDPEWQRWQASGTLDPAAGAGKLRLHTDSVRATPALFERVPFVPAVVWEQVKLDCRSDVTVDLDWGPGRPARYRVEASPRDAALTVTSIDLHAADTAGGVVVEDGVVTLKGVRGTVAAGTMATDATLDFRREPADLRFDLSADRLDVKKLPESWKFPEQVTGRLTGNAKLVVTVGDEVRTNGDGAGRIEDATVAGFPTAEPITLRLRPEGGRFRFASGRPTAAALLATLLVAPPAEETPPGYLDIDLTLRDVDLAELLKRLEVNAPIRAAGRVTLAVKVSLPVDAPRTPARYRVVGDFSSPKLTLEALDIEQAKARIRFAEGVLQLEELAGRVGDGSFAGKASLGVEPPGDLTADLALDKLPLDRVLGAVPGGAGVARGAVTGRASLRAPAGKVNDLAAWDATAALSADRVEALGWGFDAPRADLKLAGGTLSLTQLRGTLEGAAVAGRADLGVTGERRLSAKLTLNGIDLAAVQRLAPDVRPPVKVTGRLDAEAELAGTLTPPALTSSGTVRAGDLNVGGFRAAKLTARWQQDRDRVRIDGLRAELYGGELTGSAALPVAERADGRADLAVKGVDLGELFKDVPAVPLPVAGQADGTLTATIPPAQGGKREPQVALDLKSARLRVRGIPTEKLTGTARLAGDQLTYDLEGSALGGTFKVEGKAPVRPKDAPAGSGQVRIQGWRLALLGDALRLRSLAPLRGTVDAALTFQTQPPQEVRGSGQLTVRRLAWGDRQLAEELRTDLLLRDAEFRLNNLTGALAGGVVGGRVAFRPNGRSFVNVTVLGADAARLLRPVPGLAENVSGTVDLRLRGRVGADASGSGEVSFPRGRIYGVEVLNWRLPFDWTVVPGRGVGQVAVRDTTAVVGAGRVTGRATLDFGYATRLDGDLRLVDVELRQLVRDLGDASPAGSGRFNGRIDFSAADLRSANDLRAALYGRLPQVQALQFPVLLALRPYLAVGGTAPYNDGEVRASLANGILRVERLALTGRQSRLFIEGTVTLQGRLNLDVIASTGEVLPNPTLLGLLRRSVPAFGPVPLSVLEGASRYLSNRTVRLRATGTIAAPTVQVRPLSLVGEEAARFFLGRSGVVLP